MPEKSKRREVLMELLRGGELASQADLARAMGERGFSLTQSSISRELRELGVVKLAGKYVLVSLDTDFLSGVLSLVCGACAVGQHLVVVKTKEGAASVVASAIDKAQFEGVAGTIAGDDTVFIATLDSDAQGDLMGLLSP